MSLSLHSAHSFYLSPNTLSVWCVGFELSNKSVGNDRQCVLRIDNSRVLRRALELDAVDEEGGRKTG